jgi:hypothetical protein
MPAKKGDREQIVRKRFAELLTKDIEIDIDEAFLVNVKFLRKVLKTISSGKNKWWVEKELAESVVFGHSGTDDSEMPQVAPLLIRYPKTSAGMVCLHWTAWKIVQQGQYTCEGRTVDDPEEIDRFFRPLERWLAQYYLQQRRRARQDSLVYRDLTLKQRSVTLEDCIRSDEEHLTKATQKLMMREFLVGDDIFYTPHKVLSNEDGFITDGRGFAKAFRELTQKGCNPATLAESIGSFLSYQAARSKEGRERSRFPSSNKLIILSDKLSELASEVWLLESRYHISTAVIDFNKYSTMVRNEAEREGRKATEVLSLETNDVYSLEKQYEDMAGSMETYAKVLKLWTPPRSDSIRAYGLIAPLVCAQIGTGKPQYELVATLLRSCTNDEANNEYTDTSLLKKKLKYFQTNFSEGFKELKSSLEEAHNYTGPCYPPVDFDSALKNLEKSE